MIYRRLKDAFARQDWFAVCLEMVVVVVGVLIALAANNWAEAQKERELEIQTLKELKSALVLDLERTNVDRALHAEASTRLALLQEHISNGLPFSDSLGVYFGSMLVTTIWVRYDAPYQTLQERGVDLISNDSLRIAIGQLYGFQWQSALKSQDYHRDFTTTHFFPYMRDSFDENLVPLDYSELLNSSEFKVNLGVSLGMHSHVSGQLDSTANQIQDVIEKIKSELGALEES